MAKLVLIDGTEKEVQPKDAKNGFDLQELYDLIGNGCEMIQVIETRDGYCIFDEEFRVRLYWEDKRNPKANEMLMRDTGFNYDICGNVIFCSPDEFK